MSYSVPVPDMNGLNGDMLIGVHPEDAPQLRKFLGYEYVGSTLFLYFKKDKQ